MATDKQELMHTGGCAPDTDANVDLYAHDEQGQPVHTKQSVQALHADAVKHGDLSSAQDLHAHAERRFGGGGAGTTY